MDCILPVSSVHGIFFFQARILEWVPLPPPRYLPDPGIKLASLALQVVALLLSHGRSPQIPIFMQYFQTYCISRWISFWRVRTRKEISWWNVRSIFIWIFFYYTNFLQYNLRKTLYLWRGRCLGWTLNFLFFYRGGMVEIWPKWDFCFLYEWHSLKEMSIRKPRYFSVIKERYLALRNKASDKLFFLVTWSISGHRSISFDCILWLSQKYKNVLS